jgi:exodeoxyribonuclease VII large subunit
VIARGRVTTYPDKSKYQIVIDELEPAGVGALMALLEQRKKMLAAEGLFHEARKKTLPYLPRIVGVGHLADRRGDPRYSASSGGSLAPCHVLVWPVRVQGETCARRGGRRESPASTRSVIGAAVPRPDLIIVARGGGSLEDLCGASTRRSWRERGGERDPLISAVGH